MIRRPNLLLSFFFANSGFERTPLVKLSVKLAVGSGNAIGWLNTL